MFDYSDPTGGPRLLQEGALALYQQKVHSEYVHQSCKSGSAFAPLEAFSNLGPSQVQRADIEWFAFPQSQNASDQELDSGRFELQDEYVEWQVVTSGSKA